MLLLQVTALLGPEDHLKSLWGVLKDVTGPQIRVCTRKLFILFLNQNICCGYSKEPSY